MCRLVRCPCGDSTVLLLVGAPALYILSWIEVLKAGVLPTDGGSVAIFMFAGLVFAVLVAPFVLGTTWLCLRRYTPGTSLLAWRADRPVRSILAGLVFEGGAAVFAVPVIHELFVSAPWYEFIPTAIGPPLHRRAPRDAGGHHRAGRVDGFAPT